MGDWVKFGGNDPWFYMRLVDNLANTFPHRILFDPYALYPGGSNIGIPPFFLMLLGSTTWIIGLGSPSEYVVETVGAYFPAILGAMVTIPVYFIGKEIFNRNVGLLCAALIAILPGEFLFRSLLGFTDHHIAEVLFSTTAALFLIMAIKRAKENEISFRHIRSRDWGYLRKPLIYAVLAGLALGMYLLSWIGALLFVFIIFAYLVIQYIIDHLRGRSTDYLCIIGVPLFLIALIMVIPYSDVANLGKLGIPSLTIAVLALLVLSGVSILMAHRNLKRAYYPFALVCLGLAGVGILYAIDPNLFRSMLNTFEKVFIPSATKGTIMEARPIFSDFDIANLAEHRVWYYFTTGLFLFPVALLLLIYVTIKERNSEKTFLIVWCLIMLAATLGQVRFAYYFAVNVALLTGYFCWKIPGWITWFFGRIGFREASPDDKKRNKGRARERGETTGFLYLKPRYISRALAAIIVFFLAFYPNIGEAINTAENPWGPNDAWRNSLVWMRENTPDPFEDPDFYYALYEKPPAGEEYAYPESAYGIMSWWDYGYWITRIAHRIPNASPSGQANAKEAAEFFVDHAEVSANEILDKMGSQYVILDFEMSTSKFHVMPTWAEESLSDFYEMYYQTTQQGIEPFQTMYYPRYYESMCSRLYNFGGETVVPQDSTWAIKYSEVEDEDGNKYKMITDAANEGLPFTTYDEAKTFIDDNPDYVIVGIHPFSSPVPLVELEHYELIHESASIQWGESEIPYVKIFQYSP
jgi:dolichyl-diphosphooligosaccharide--protein glycosyltransferase